MRRRRIVATAVGVLVIAGATLLAADRLDPPDLSRGREISAVVRDSSGGILRAFTTREGDWRLKAAVPDVEPRLVAFLQAYEDKRFLQHPGVDPLALGRAAAQWIMHGRVLSGGSTLTMQVARLLEPHPHSLAGKVKDIWRAVQLEARFSKDEILGLYLTLAPYGGNLEGVRAASLAYFGKEPAHLSDAEAALLVALPQSPTRRRPDRHPDAARAATAKVLARLQQAGVLTPDRTQEALETTLPARRLALPFAAPHLARRLAGPGASGAASGGDIMSTIDGGLQAAVEALIRTETARMGDGGAIAVLVVETAGRRVRAYASGADYFRGQGEIDLVQAQRSPGSALKPFIYGLAFDDLAIHPETLIDDRPMAFGGYAPQNFDRDFHGTVTIRRALQQSLNIPAIQLIEAVGPERLAAELRRSGVRLAFPDAGRTASLPLALGGVGISLADLTRLYAGLADHGRVRSLVLQDGTAQGEGERLLSATAAYYLRQILAGSPLPDGLADRSVTAGTRRIAFKTGTSYGFRDALAMGYSPGWTVGVWVGRTEGTPRPGAYGRTIAAPILFKVFDLLPPEPGGAGPGGVEDDTPPPAEAIEANSSRQLPIGLRRFTGERRIAAFTGQSPRIVYPPDGAILDLRRRSGPAAALESLALIAEGGKPPFRWIVNGKPLPPTPLRNDGVWQPDGEGFVRIVVVDAADRSAVAEVRLK